MNRSEQKNASRTFAIGKHSALNDISKLLDGNSRSDQLVIAVYLLEQNRFLYGNAGFKKLLGTKKMKPLLERGWDFWFVNMCPEECLMIKNRLRTFFSTPFDQKPMTLRYHMYDANENRICMKHEIVLHNFNSGTMALNYFFDISERERIERCLKGQNRNGFANNRKNVRPISPREEECSN